MRFDEVMRKDLLIVLVVAVCLLGAVALAVADTQIFLSGSVEAADVDTNLTAEPGSVAFAVLVPGLSDVQVVSLTPGNSFISIVGMTTNESADKLFADANLWYLMEDEIDSGADFVLISEVSNSNPILFNVTEPRVMDLQLIVPDRFDAVTNASAVLTLTVVESNS